MEGSGKCSAVHPAAVPSTRQRETGCSPGLPPGISPSRMSRMALWQRARCLEAPIRPHRHMRAPPPRPVPAAAPKDLSDDFGRLLHEMDRILGEPTIPLLIRLVLDLKLTVDRSDKARPKWVIDHRTEPK